MGRSSPATNAIKTDYESSAAEDYDSYTSNKYENAECALLSYSRTNKLDKLQTLLVAKSRNEINLDLNYKGHHKKNFSWSALHLACYFGHLEVVQQLLAKKQFRDELDINIKNSSGDTPLHKATLTNRVQIVQLLLSNGANVFIKNCDDLLAKQLTCDKHIFEMLEAAEKADKNRLKLELFKAVDNGDLTILQDYFSQNCDSLRSNTEDLRSGLSTESCDQDGTVSGSLDQAQSDAQDRTAQSFPPADLINSMIDAHGNTLLHLAARRGFKAVCILLLEHGLDPYRQNNLGQTCIDLASYQLRQLFMTVKPANTQLKRLSSQHVARLEGPLMKKVRILGWKQIYAVLENGVFLLFNNRRDSMNRSRRGYKYLESAICEPDPGELGMFTITFSDRSRATFLVGSDLVNQYHSFKGLRPPDISKQLTGNQVELVRQKWIDALRDHIAYSTEFIRKGLSFNLDDEGDGAATGCDNIASLNHLLPMDTIKSFFQEARAHYNILERHAESLCGLVQSVAQQGCSTHSTSTFETSMRKAEAESLRQNNSVTSSTAGNAGGSRLFGLIRGPRKAASEDEQAQTQPSAAAMNSTRARNENFTNEFIQDNWSCILFHLRLLMESTENTKTTMGQALALMEHQEQLRQNRIQDQEERCRVLEDSLHALARDHHELEKSLSMSQLYDSAARIASRSISMSTDLNEYYDAFEDFDDEKTMTPDSTPSDEELDKRIREVIEEQTVAPGMPGEGSTSTYNIAQVNEQAGPGIEYAEEEEGEGDGEFEDDLESNCSALTADTVTDQYTSAGDASQHQYSCASRSMAVVSQNRTRLPAPMVPRDQVSIWSILKNCIGKELSKITMPVVFNEPLTMLQRAAEGLPHTRYLKMADMCEDPVERMEMVCAFIIATISCNCHRIIKPFNPLLYETFEYDHELEDGSHVKGIAQQVSHHPPITAVCGESDNFVYNGVINPKIKFWGRSIEITHDGASRIHLKSHNETYLFNSVPCSVHNIIVGKLWFEHHGPLVVTCQETNIQASLTFKPAGWFSNDVHRFDGFIISGFKKSSEKKKVKFIYGKWSDYIKSVDYFEYEKYMNDTQQRPFRIPDRPDANGITSGLENMSISDSVNSVNNNNIHANDQLQRSTEQASKPPTSSKGGDKKSAITKSESTQSLDIPNSRTLWRLESQYLSEYYNFTLFTMRLNELTSELEKTLPRTDSRFRPDVRKLEEGDLDAAASEKQRLEDKQREARSRDKRFKDPSADFLFFEQTNAPQSKDRVWLYKGGYWENKCNPEKFPDLF